MNFRRLPFIAALFLITLSAKAQHEDHDHEHSRSEIGLSNNAVYNVSEKEAAYSIHVHLIRTFEKHNNFGIGIGYERIFDDHKHNAVSVILMYRPIEQFSINIAPGIIWLDSQKNSLKPAMHIEGLYEFELGHFHIGPLIGVGFNTEDLHAAVGLHLAVGF